MSKYTYEPAKDTDGKILYFYLMVETKSGNEMIGTLKPNGIENINEIENHAKLLTESANNSITDYA